MQNQNAEPNPSPRGMHQQAIKAGQTPPSDIQAAPATAPAGLASGPHSIQQPAARDDSTFHKSEMAPSGPASASS